MSHDFRKVCLLGAVSSGKTALVTRYLHRARSESIFPDLGVKVDRKQVRARGHTFLLILWDLAGEPSLTAQHDAHLRDTDGYLLVADGTQPATLDFALAAHERARRLTQHAPARLLLTHCDQRDAWRLGPADLARISAAGLAASETSAVTGYGVESAFLAIAEDVALKRHSHPA